MFYQLKPGSKAPRVVVYVYKDGKQIPLPRRLTKHLDGRPESDIDDWMRYYAAVNSISLRSSKLDLGDLEKPLKRFLDWLRDRGRYKTTVALYEYHIRFALPTFRDEPHFNGWYLLGGKLTDDMRRAGLSPNQRKNVNQAFQVFYRWLQAQGIVEHRHALLLDKIDLGRRNTPLKYALKPDEVLAWVPQLESTELKFMALAGYFFSLRPSEVFGLRKQDFIAGNKARIFEDSKVCRRAGLFDGLAVSVRSCRRPDGEFYAPTKRKPGGIVACFSKEAAKRIVELVNKAEDELIITRYTPHYWAKKWAKQGIAEITPKDLRRASLYWLGHYTEIPFVGLKNHARHTNADTTSLYVRRPEEAFDDSELGDLDLEA